MGRNNKRNPMSIIWKMKQKKGASLPMVIMIGAALVIWAMALLPLMGTAGVQAEDTAEMERDYLDSRSAIEFAKGELVKIASTGLPYTFVVVDNGGNSYTAYPKRSGNTVTGDYSSRVDYELNVANDDQDIPLDNALGKKVAAICAVIPGDGRYDISIMTFNEGVAGMTYDTFYVLGGNMLIYPESYQKTQALPLSDFIVVDGKYGDNEVWESNILTYGYDDKENDWDGSGYFVTSSKTFVNGFREWMKPWELNRPTDADYDPDYADTGRFPAVFKTTAEASYKPGKTVYTEVPSELNAQKWILPTADNVEVAGGTVQGKAGTELAGKTLSGATIYYNGVAGAPSKPGTYQVKVNYGGTGAYNPAAGAVNILPVNGLVLGTVTIDQTPANDITVPSCTVTVTGNSSIGYTATITDVSDSNSVGVYGYTTAADGSGIVWSTSNTLNDLKLNGTDNYYFYCYKTGYIDSNGIIHEPSAIKYVGKAVCNNGAKLSASDIAGEVGTGKQFMIVSGNSILYRNGNNLSNTTIPAYWTDDSNYLWTVTDTGAGWTFKTADQTQGIQLDNGRTEGKSHAGLRTNYYYNFTGKVGSNVTVFKRENNNFAVTQRLITQNGRLTGEEWNNYTAYFEVDNSYPHKKEDGSVTVQEVKFMRVPTASDGAPGTSVSYAGSVSVAAVDWTKSYGYSAANLREDLYSNTSLDNVSTPITKLYLNGQEVSGSSTLNAGIYEITAMVNQNGIAYCVELGKLTITNTFGLSGSADITIAGNTAQIVYNNWNANAGAKYYGYKVGGRSYWSTSSDLKEIPAGDVTFLVAQDGKDQLAGPAVKAVGSHAFGSTMTLDPDTHYSAFTYALASSTTQYWYSLPAGISKGMISMRFYNVETGNWETSYTPGKITKYGAYISGTNYAEETGNIFILPAPLPIAPASTDGGTTYYASYLKGRSMYFMDDTTSIHTHGTSVSVYTDLLVLNKPYSGGGNLYVYSYEGDTHVLLFAVNAFAGFEAKNFYLIPSGTDLLSVSDATKASWKYGTTVFEDEGGNPTIEFDEDVKNLFNTGQYPYINLDVAYATNEQLARIISGETIDWTNDGVLSGSDGTNVYNEMRVVCAYVTEITTDVTRRANRILFATDGELLVPTNVSVETRYLSVDAEQIVQGHTVAGAGKFILNNLAESSMYMTFLKDILGEKEYNSETLQMDYERNTEIYLDGIDVPLATMEAQICRYPDGTNLFAAPESNEKLMVVYTTNAIQSHFDEGATNDLKVVDRYVSIIPGAKTNIVANQSFWGGWSGTKEMQIYTNYLHIGSKENADGSKTPVSEIQISDINLVLARWKTDILINTQESGYTEKEYLGLFKWNTAESYNGTLIYVENDVKVTRITASGSQTKWWYKGFYHVGATTGGTSLWTIVNNPSIYKITDQKVEEMQVVIDPETGKIDDAYVDTGIMNGQGMQAGFGGGTVK